ncbi:hypothetical protein [Natronococcus roseus]|uniref:hypothetical protein n=1 Tax=Natronococcus roseus TaxID=1052014 RepID=UPI00374D5A7F
MSDENANANESANGRVESSEPEEIGDTFGTGEGILFSEDMGPRHSRGLVYLFTAVSVALIVWLIYDPSRTEHYPILADVVSYGVGLLILGTFFKILGTEVIADLLSAWRGGK